MYNNATLLLIVFCPEKYSYFSQKNVLCQHVIGLLFFKELKIE